MASKPLRPGIASDTGKPIDRTPVESRLTRAGRSFNGDLRNLPFERPVAKERPERGEPSITRGLAGKQAVDANAPEVSAPANETSVPTRSAPAPSPTANFDGLDRENWGNGSPPDTNGDVGPNHYIQSVNTSVGIYDKQTGALITAFTFNTLMSQGNFGNLCDTDNFGDPVVLYDTFEDRWVLTDFAFKLDASDNVINPPGSYQCFAVSKTSDPVSGGWNFYSINTAGGLGDYPKFGIWTDGLYMTASMFDYAATGGFQNPRAYAFNKAQMYAGAPTVQVVSFNLPAADFTVLPSNARLQTGTPPPGTPNYYVSTWQFLNGLSVYKFHVDWDKISLSTFSDAVVPIAATSWPNANVGNAPQSGTTNTIETLEIRAMMQNQYTNIGGVESVWNTHTVRRADTSGFAAPRWYQLTVTSGTINSSITQAATWDPDGANVMYRFVPSLAVDRAGNMALGYSTSSSTTFPSIKYAGRLSTDPVNTFSQTEQTLFAGTASQTGTVTRWGDYSAMSLDPDGCTYWFTTQYVNPALPQSGTNRWKTRIGSFKFAQCTPVGNGGTISGQVTANPGGAPIQGATVSLGSRSTTTDSNGNYSFTNLPAGTYPGMAATAAGLTTTTASTIVVTDGNITTRNFSLSTSAASGCLTDTSQSDFQTGVPTNADLTSSPGDVKLSAPVNLDQHADDNGFGSGYGFSNTSLIGQTFTPAVTGELRKVDVNIFCASCSGTNPNMTLEVRTTSGGNPVMTAGGLLATSTIAGTSSGSGGFFTFNFSTPPTLTSGVQYGIVIRLVAARTTGTQAWVSTNGDTYAGGRRKVCSTSSCANATGSNANSDLLFKSYMYTGFATSGNLVSGAKDANPATGKSPTWGTLSWNGTTPANTTLKFQAAASDNAAGVFSFVGPDGTANTFFTSGASLSQFNGKRFLKYKALLTGTSTATPTLADVTICYDNVTPTVAISGQVKDSANNPLSGVLLTLSGSQSGTTTTDGSGNYSFTGLASGGNYTVTPSKQSYAFSPQNRVYNNMAANQTNANFTGRVVRKPADFDGDSKTDISRWNSDTGDWNITKSLTNTLRTHLDWGRGSLGDILALGDYDGDGKTDLAVFRPSDGNWYIVKSTDGSVLVKNWGGAGDVPVPGDYDADGITDVAVFRLSEGNWYILNSANNTMTVKGWGDANDKLVPGDYDGDGKTDIAVFRPSDGNWYIINSSTNAATIQGWGASADQPVPGDYDGDGKTDMAVFRPSEGNWYIINSSGGTTVKGWGASTDQPVPGDYDGDGKTDIAVFRPSESNWYILKSSDNTLSLINFGSSSEVPLPAAYIKILP
ncbi:MAG: carboxypeptidase regulatory-like domain-containing protein [Pyrinomonadaceae bacterium]|nr:carboxypeptidase regulatory-like domain-containing protein [Pyrinomonadaceae bacterium]